MTGICGIVNFEKENFIDKNVLDLMCSGMNVGSQEATRDFIDGNVGIAAIGNKQEYSENHKRSVFVDERLYILVSGDLLRRRGQGNAEHIAELYKRDGEKCFGALEGQYNFCLFDKKKNELFVVTDSFSNSALYYYSNSKVFLFASKIRAIAETNITSLTIDNSAIYLYLNLEGFIPSPGTVYKEIEKLTPGSYIVFQDGKIDVKKYWEIPYHPNFSLDESQFSEKIFLTTKEAVKKSLDMCPDTDRVGAFLSGGLDSSTVSGMMAEILGKRIKAFTIDFKEEAYSESEYARIASDHFGLDHHEYVVTPKDAVNAFKALVKGYDEPFGNTSAIAAYYCMKIAQENGVDILFGGDAGDENFAGYTRYVKDKQYDIYQKIPAALRKKLIEPLILNLPENKLTNYIKHSNLQNPERFFFNSFYFTYNRDNIFSGEFLETIDPKGPLDFLKGLYETPQTDDALSKLLYLDARLALIDNDLKGKIDKICQLTDMKAFFPFLDKSLWELGGEIPPGMKLKGFRKKDIFRKAFNDFLPQEILKKKKHGFGLPYSVWMRDEKEVRDFTKEVLLDTRTRKRGFFKEGLYQKLIKENDEEPSPYYGNLLSIFLMLELWFNEREDNK